MTNPKQRIILDNTHTHTRDRYPCPMRDSNPQSQQASQSTAMPSIAGPLRSAGTPYILIKRLTPNDPYMGLTTLLNSKRCILYIYSTNIGTEYFKHALYSPFFFSSRCILFHNANLFGSVFFTFYIQGVLKLKKNNSGAKGLI